MSEETAVAKASRARARTPRAEVDERVELVESMMAGLIWERGKSNRELAARWGVSVGAVDEYAAEAGRRRRRALTNVDEVTETVTARMSRIVTSGEDKDAIKAGDVWTRIVGARAPERHEHVVAQEFSALPPTAKSARMRELAARLLAEADRLDGIVDVPVAMLEP